MAPHLIAFLSFCVVIAIAYSLSILSFLKGWNHLKKFQSSGSRPEIKLSIIIPARNEESNISNLLHDLSQQSYPRENFEILLMDDGSDDATNAEAEKFLSLLPLKIITKIAEGKKKAIHDGICFASGEIIVTTDADCRVPATWLETIASYYQIHQPSMIIGPVMMTSFKKGFLYAFQKLEFASLVASAAGAAGAGKPVMCNGANLAYRKKDYFSLTDPLMFSVSSGDDMMLMLQFKKANYEIHYLKSCEALVKTNVEDHLNSFIKQRVRWTSKSKFYRDYDTIKTAIVILLFNALIVGSAFAGFFNYRYFLLFVGLLMIKSFVDFPLLYQFHSFFEQKKSKRWFALVQIIYPFYIFSMGIIGNMLSPTWKGRK